MVLYTYMFVVDLYMFFFYNRFDNSAIELILMWLCVSIVASIQMSLFFNGFTNIVNCYILRIIRGGFLFISLGYNIVAMLY